VNQSRPRRHPLAPARSGAGRVLLVDDSDHSRAALARHLVRHGYNIDEAQNGPEALSKVRQISYDLVLLDPMMPGMSGLEVLNSLRTGYSQGELPVIILTGVQQSELVAQALRSGANDYVTKPVDASVVAARIQSQIARCESERALRVTDPVTGLGNRQLILERVAAMSRSMNDRWMGVSLVLVSLDRFEEVNVSFGCTAGDAILREVAHLLESRLASMPFPPGTYTVARVHGGDFAVLFDSIAEQDALRLAEAFLRDLHTPARVSGIQLDMSASVGIVHERRREYTAEDMLGDAGLAARRAREKGGFRWEVFQSVMREHVKTHTSVAMGLTHAIERGELLPVYQPEIDLHSGEVVGFECLLRWMRPGHGCLSPAEFIAVAEQTNLIVPIGTWLTREACRQLAVWQRRFPRPRPFSMNVNLSVRQLDDPHLVHNIAHALAESELAPGTLGFELTETALATNLDSAAAVLRSLRSLGVVLHLDDFGTGYSSLNYLRNFRFDGLKVDRSFVSRLAFDSETGGIVALMVQLAHGLDMKVVAEGIEDVHQLDAVRRVGFDIGQGYHFARPVGAETIEWLLSHRVHYLDPDRSAA
jgi:diguanylate cyclase